MSGRGEVGIGMSVTRSRTFLCIPVILSSALLGGCVTPGTEAPAKPIIVRTHLYDPLINGSMTGIDPDATFVVAGDKVLPEWAVKLSVVPKREKVISDPRGLDEYYVDVSISCFARSLRDEVFLFHSDRVGNGGIMRLVRKKKGGYDFVEVSEKEEPDLGWRIFVKISSQYTSVAKIPKRVRRFMKTYGWADDSFFR